MSDDGAFEETKYGTLIAPNLLAPYHDHFFNFRIDLDVDGEAKEFKKAKIRPMNLSKVDIPRKSMWGVTYETVESEVDARSNVTPNLPSKWLFVNPGKESGLAHNPGYVVIPDSYIYNVYLEEDMAVKRNSYIEHQLFVTPYDPSQKYAGGEYPFQSKGDDTLMTWTDLDRPIVNTDIVAYYTIGFHHIPRMEDWPIMPTNWGSFKLSPFNFFTHNPAITLDPAVLTETPIPKLPTIKVQESFNIHIEEDENVTKTSVFSFLPGLGCFLLGVAVSQVYSFVSCKRSEYLKLSDIRPGIV
jgi:primary-amine oxidase